MAQQFPPPAPPAPLPATSSLDPNSPTLSDSSLPPHVTDPEQMKIVVTGSSGSLAKGLIDLVLSTTKHSLILVDRKPPPAGSELDNPRIEYVTAELTIYHNFLEILSKRVDALVHFASFPNPFQPHAHTVHNTNVTLSFNALQAAVEANIKRVVMASSVNATGACYSINEPTYDYFPVDEQHPMRPEDSYSLSKAIMEVQCDAFARGHPDMSIASLRFHHCVDGRKDTSHIVKDARKDLWGSETDYEDIVAPRPRHSYSPTWLNNFDDPDGSQHVQPAVPIRVSSPLNPNAQRHARKLSIPTFPASPKRQSSLSLASAGAVRVRQDSWLTPTSLNDARMESPARRWVRWMAKTGMRDWVLPISIAAAVWVKWTAGLGGYSGRATPLMYGDYEAQRHWMEITVHLPTREWYFYDLPYWGLDYPPLTAYVSYICGLVAHYINPSWVALDQSRGIESDESKVFMRASVLVLDLIVYIPSIIWFTRSWWTSRSRRTQNIALLTILLQPSLILIDNGHFQYNSVMLGLTVLTLDFLMSGQDLLAAIAFVASRCIGMPGSEGIVRLAKIGGTTILSFLVLFAPFVFQAFPTNVAQSLHRIFPFSRGLFEDKVANFWCATNVVIKWKKWISPSALPKIATLVTLISILPPMLHILGVSWSLRETEPDPVAAPPSDPKPAAGNAPSTSTTNPTSEATDQKQPFPSTNPLAPISETQLSDRDSRSKSGPSPTINLVLFALFNTSMAFFLFSFQVHEKSVLLPLLPLTLIISGRSEADVESGTWELGILINNVAVFSMWPLLKKDGLGLQYATLTFLWNYIVGYNPLSLPASNTKLLSLATYSVIAALHGAEILVSPPARYPDLYPVLNVLLCSGIFGLSLLWGLKKQMEAGWGISGLSMTPKKPTPLPRPLPSFAGRSTKPHAPVPPNRRATMDPRLVKEWSNMRAAGESETSGNQFGSGTLRSRRRDSIPAKLGSNGDARS
ncbi:Glucosyltransferase-like protein [Tulasnella sp. 427]|nr:Glucosyltransferase-like protein [Tulasnella sp. 427]